ncbi:hypothetical protein [Allorhizocola rhizosphaerae]|uniref:hypothetical protein n=1 Tax=Allorhizocola rhizosphaerae TaxID=1872709 RepID=UPI000E3D98BF|nr:hypothetical protein [Allorhizocola rhizosphaerae]
MTTNNLSIDLRVRDLALQLIEQLGEDSSRLLERWLAFRIAELVFQIDNAASADRQAEVMQACTDLVLQVWNSRQRWQRGWPPESAAAIIDALRKDRSPWEPRRRQRSEGEMSWAETMSSLELLQKEERQLWQLVAIGSTDMSDTDSWLKSADWAMEGDEKTTLAELSEIVQQYGAQLDEHIRRPAAKGRAAPSDPDKRIAWLKAELKAIQKRKIALLDSLNVATVGEAE